MVRDIYTIDITYTRAYDLT